MVDREILKKVMSGIIETAEKERRESEPYKDLFKKAENIEGFLHDVEFRMTQIVLDAYQAYKDKHGKENKALWEVLLALPYIAHSLEREIAEKEGTVCCVDKAYYLLSKMVLNGDATKST